MISNINLRTTSSCSDVQTSAQPTAAHATRLAGMRDHISMSNTAQHVMQILDDRQIPEDLKRIVHLQEAIGNGIYKVDADQIATKLLQDIDDL